MTDREAELISWLLRGGLPEVSQLLAQIQAAMVRGECPFIDIEVEAAAPRASREFNGTIEARNNRFEDDPTWSHVLLWVEKGTLSALELAWVAANAPSEWPEPSQLEIVSLPGVAPSARLQQGRRNHLISWPMLIAGTIGAIAGLASFMPASCAGGRCQLNLFAWVPFLNGLRVPQGLTEHRTGGAFILIGAVLGAWLATRSVVFFRRRKEG